MSVPIWFIHAYVELVCNPFFYRQSHSACVLPIANAICTLLQLCIAEASVWHDIILTTENSVNSHPEKFSAAARLAVNMTCAKRNREEYLGKTRDEKFSNDSL
jgi:hypothetical protein